MMKSSFVILMGFLLITILMVNASALRINEIEANPSGEDSGFEWVELYSEDNVNLEGYYLENGDGGKYNLSSSFSGYLIINFSGRWLDNQNETVYLKLNGEIIDESENFDDSKNNDLTHSFCNNEWLFIASTKNEENTCEVAQTNTNNNEDNQEIEKKESIIEESPKIKETIRKDNITKDFVELVETKNSKISLTNRDNEVNYEFTKTYKTRNLIIYSFIGFCVLLVILIASKKI